MQTDAYTVENFFERIEDDQLWLVEVPLRFNSDNALKQ